MKNLELIANTQGIKGGNTKIMPLGYCILEAKKKGQPSFAISVDTYQGHGVTYEERKDHQICFSFKNEHYTLNPEQLHSMVSEYFKKNK
ncbi:MAG: hypothetical protein EKK63_04955 [Acinetobacter sp.]|uniref:hypothetical protein n=1 Tax=Acinetobacter sp. TaxID=472 RepID=UPI000FB9174A|nr:hypothetical protein [Acinetobacter sp.]RUP41606.1 MAG: hypothetical protein EKK63_04955 [Acinetobacter sp.]